MSPVMAPCPVSALEAVAVMRSLIDCQDALDVRTRHLDGPGLLVSSVSPGHEKTDDPG